MYVFLFDIDGTLLHTGGAGMTALRQALQATFDVSCDELTIAISGRSDRGIATDLFSAYDIEDSDANWERYRDSYLQYLAQNLARFEGRVLDGVVPLLQGLANRDDVSLGLLTGNVRLGARAKLGHYDLNDYFGYGGFGDRQRKRDDVAREALQAAQESADAVELDRVWVIGDTPHDVTCARAIGARAVAVATGFADRSELEAVEPDLLLDDLVDSNWLAEIGV